MVISSDPMRKLAHIVNPVRVPESSGLGVAQPITFETMRRARHAAGNRALVEHFSAQYPEDSPVVPDDFIRTPDLTESVMDHGHFERPRKLPLIKHILDRLYEASDAEYLIYTNVDIALMPGFYRAVNDFIDEGFDALVINRRTISGRFCSIDEIPDMCAQHGEPHRGWDCFVFRREAYPSYVLGTACIGAPRVGLVLLANLAAHAARFSEYRQQHLTFHIGDDRSWWSSRYSDYADHNAREAERILAEIEHAKGPFSRSTPVGIHLARRRRYGFLYELAVRHCHLPLRWTHPFRKERSS